MEKYKYVLVVFLLVVFAKANAQDTLFIKKDNNWDNDKVDYVTDTLIFSDPLDRRNILVGNTILPGTNNQNQLYFSGLWFKSVEKSNCKSEVLILEEEANDTLPEVIESRFLKEGIFSASVADSILLVDISIEINCCATLLYDAALTEEGILNLIYYEYDSTCACACCFGLVYVFKMNEYFDKKITHVMLNGDKSTLKPIVYN